MEKQEEYKKGIVTAHGVGGYKIVKFTEIGIPIKIGSGKKVETVEKRAAKMAAEQGLKYFGRKCVPGL